MPSHAQYASVSLVLLAAATVGCGTTRNTLAQELAWERIEKCKGIGASLQVSRVEPDGRIWWQTSGGNQGSTEFYNCLRDAADEQARRRVTSAPPPNATTATAVVATGGSGASAGIPLPRWKVGDEWAYREETPDHAVTFVWSVDDIEIVDGVEHYVVKSGTRRVYYRSTDGALMLQKVSGVVVNRYTPAGQAIAWPLTAGKTWENTYSEERPEARSTEEITRACEAGPEETITVPAGTFVTIPITCRNRRNGALVYRWWYSPMVKHIVREEWQQRNGQRVRELIKFQLR